MQTLTELAGRLTLPGLPDWTGLLALLLLMLVALAYLLLPFAVFGVKGRLETLESQLDEIQMELRGLALRLAEAAPRRSSVSDDWLEPSAEPRRGPEPARRDRPPVPPRATQPEAGTRAEPRLDLPRRRAE
jgi:hypothetical protein